MSILAINIGIQLILWIVITVLLLIFKFTTVKRLRKNTDTKYSLGLEIIFGWDAINVAQALTLPHLLIKLSKKSRFPNLYADAKLLSKHTNKYEKTFANIFYIIFLFNSVYAITTILLYQFGFFDIS